jgi:subtilisin-like proprotein convertase family protein
MGNAKAAFLAAASAAVMLALAGVPAAASPAGQAAAAVPCSATNTTDVPIVDLQTVESAVTLSGCTGTASNVSAVEVHIVHTYRGDLVVTLVAQDGSPYILQNRSAAAPTTSTRPTP